MPAELIDRSTAIWLMNVIPMLHTLLLDLTPHRLEPPFWSHSSLQLKICCCSPLAGPAQYPDPFGFFGYGSDSDEYDEEEDEDESDEEEA